MLSQPISAKPAPDIAFGVDLNILSGPMQFLTEPAIFTAFVPGKRGANAMALSEDQRNRADPLLRRCVVRGDPV